MTFYRTSIPLSETATVYTQVVCQRIIDEYILSEDGDLSRLSNISVF